MLLSSFAETKHTMDHQSALLMKPVEEPTKVDLITFKTNVGTALLKCRSTNEGGHVHLILNQEEYRDKINDETATLPCKTIRPKKPIGDTVTNIIIRYLQRDVSRL